MSKSGGEGVGGGWLRGHGGGCRGVGGGKWVVVAGVWMSCGCCGVGGAGSGLLGRATGR